MRKIKEVIKQNEKEFVSENNIEYTTILKKQLMNILKPTKFILKAEIFLYTLI